MRLVSVAATAGSAFLVARLARRWWSAAEAAWAPALFLSTFLVVTQGSRLQLDPLLAFLCLGALAALDADAPDARSATRNVLAAGACAGLAALVKGPIAFVNALQK